MQYNVYQRKWLLFACQKGISPFNPPLDQALNFLTHLYHRGLSYSTVNAARSALSQILRLYDGVRFGSHQVTCRVLRGIYVNCPPVSRYQSTWDVDVVLQFLKSLSPVKQLSLKDLTLKVVMLILLISCQRVQTLFTLKRSTIKWGQGETSVTFILTEVLKHSRRGTLGFIHLKQFDEKCLCVVRAIKEYLARTKDIVPQGTDNFFVSYLKPHGPVTKDRLAGWVRIVLTRAGIDVSAFKAHSVRGASTSKLASLNLPVKAIMAKASWLAESTFRKYYQKEILPVEVSNQILEEFVTRQGDQ